MGSGGEKAISLHLPLLAAAAGYPASGRPDALRMVMLDEAFTRIDEEGRRGIMGLIAKFDLDVMLTSPDFWGCCAEVPDLESTCSRRTTSASPVSSLAASTGTGLGHSSTKPPAADVKSEQIRRRR